MSSDTTVSVDTKDVKSFAKAIGEASQAFNDDELGSAPLDKNLELENKLLGEIKKHFLEKSQSSGESSSTELPEEWMARACLRTRKYDVERTKVLIEEFKGLLTELHPLSLSRVSPTLKQTTFRILPTEDATTTTKSTSSSSIPGPIHDFMGRPVLNTRMRLHKPKEFPADVMVPAIICLLLNLVRKSEAAQLRGVAILHDFRGVSLANMDPQIPKRIMKMVSGKLPLRLAQIYILSPPFWFSWIIWPILKIVLSPKLRTRIKIVSSVEELREKYFPDSTSIGTSSGKNLPVDFGGEWKIDDSKYCEEMLLGMRDVPGPVTATGQTSGGNSNQSKKESGSSGTSTTGGASGSNSNNNSSGVGGDSKVSNEKEISV